MAPAPIVAVLLADGWHNVASGLFTIGVLGIGDCGVLGYRFEETAETGPYGLAALAEALLAVPQVTPADHPTSVRIRASAAVFGQRGHAGV